MPYPESEIDLLKSILKEGKVILHPTDTIWGLGCDAQNEEAIERIYDLKSRPKEKRFLLLVSSLEMLQKYVHPVPPKASNLIQYHERPLTIIYDQVQGLPESLLAEDGSIGIRVTQDPFCQAFIEAFGGAIVSTSASISGEDFPKCFNQISPLLKDGVDYVAQYKLDQEPQDVSPSTIVSLDERNDLVFIRK